jgi:hypothetical protein
MNLHVLAPSDGAYQVSLSFDKNQKFEFFLRQVGFFHA